MTSPEPRPLRVAVLNDYPVVVAGLEAMLAPSADRVVAVAGDQATGPVEADLVLYDTFGAPDARTTGVEDILDEGAVRVVVFSWSTDEELVRSSMEAGAAGFLSKALGAEELVSRL